MVHFSTRVITINEETMSGAATIPKEVLLLLGYGDSIFAGECGGYLFISNEDFNGAVEKQLGGTKTNIFNIPVALACSVFTPGAHNVELWEDNGDIFFLETESE